MLTATENPVPATYPEGQPANGGPSQIFAWAKRIAASVFDQGLVSGSNFLLATTLARWMGPVQYGAYAIAFSIFLLIGNMHQAVLLEPMSVFQPSSYAGQRRKYIGSVVCLHVLLSTVLMAVFAAAAGVMWLRQSTVLANAMVGLIFAAPCILLLWTARSASYLDFRPSRAATASFVYCLTLVPALALVYRAQWLTPRTAFLLMGLAALVTGVFLLKRLHPILFGGSPGIREVWRKQWSYGRWSLAGVGVSWAEVNAYYLWTGTLLGMREAGGLAALISLMLPVTHLIQASGRLLLPYYADLFAKRGPLAVRRVAVRLAFTFLGAAGIYWILIGVFRHQILPLLFGAKFASFAPYVPGATLYILLASASAPQELALRAMRAPATMLRASSISASVSVVGSAIALRLFGMPGAFVSTSIAALLHITLVTTFLRKRCKELASTGTAGASVERKSKLPVLVYHHIGPPRPGIYRTLTISGKRFERHMAWLKRLGFTPVSEAQVLAWVRGEADLPPRPVLITFDDAYKDLCDHALPVLARYGFPALVFVVTGHVGGHNEFDQKNGCGRLDLMDADEIRHWAQQGIEFGAHTRLHADLTSLATKDAFDEIDGSHFDMAHLLHRPPVSLAYPYGQFNREIEERAAGKFALIFTILPGLNDAGTPAHRLCRSVTHYRDGVLDVICRASWGWSPIEWGREKIVAPLRPMFRTFCSPERRRGVIA